MSVPQLTDANTSSEWFRKVGEGSASDKPRRSSQAAIAPGRDEARRKRFVRLVTYTMAGLVAFTLLGVTSFVVRQHAMQRALTAPLPAPPAVPQPPLATPALAPPLEMAQAAAPPSAARAPSKASSTAKAGKKPAVRSPLSNKLGTTAKR